MTRFIYLIFLVAFVSIQSAELLYSIVDAESLSISFLLDDCQEFEKDNNEEEQQEKAEKKLSNDNPVCSILSSFYFKSAINPHSCDYSNPFKENTTPPPELA